MKPNIIELVVKKELCIGCGICAGVCPASVLKMSFNKIGIYEPFEEPGCLEKCKICVDACSFCTSQDDKNGLENGYFKTNSNMKFDDDLRYFLNTYEFYKTDTTQRITSASGGAGNFLLEKMLNLGIVDKVICVIPAQNGKLFEFSVLDKNSINFAKKSAYYPVSLDTVLNYVMKNDFKFAITTLPCYATSLRLAMRKNAKLRNRIKFIIALVCGQSKSKFFVQNLANLAYKKDVTINSVDFRYKIKGKSAMQFGFKFKDENGEIAIDDRADSAFKFWSSRAFTPYACNSCDDVFGKFADVSLMDAWLEDRIGDYKGHSLVVTKNSTIDEIFKNESDNFCKEIAPNLVVKSQLDVIKTKFEFSHGAKGFFAQKIVKLKKDIQRHSNENPFDLTFIDKKCDQILKIQKLVAIMRIPKRALFKFMRILKEKC